MLQQMRGSMLRQTLLVRVARDTQKIQSSDMILCLMTLSHVPQFLGSNLILSGPTNKLLMC